MASTSKLLKHTIADLFWAAVAWGFGGLFLLVSVMLLVTGSRSASAILAVSGLVCMPIVRSRIEKYAGLFIGGRRLVAGVVALMAIAVLILSAEATADAEARAKAESAQVARRAAESRANLEAEFRANKAELLLRAQRLYEQKDFAGARATVARFSSLGDSDVLRIRDRATAMILRADLQKHPTWQQEAQIYAEIARLDPSDSIAAKRAAELAPQLARDNEQKARASRIAQRAEEVRGQFSKFDGSHPAVERAIKEHMKNPASYQHVETRHTDNGDNIVVITAFRGTNSFNAVVVNSATVTLSPSGKVLAVSID